MPSPANCFAGGMMAWRNLSKLARQAGVKNKLPAHNTNHFDFLLSAPGTANITPRYTKLSIYAAWNMACTHVNAAGQTSH